MVTKTYVMPTSEPELYPVPQRNRVTSDWVDEHEQMSWVMFVMGFLVGCVATIVLVIA